MLKIIAFILLIGLIALGFAFCVAGQVGEPLPKYDMNGDGYVNVQDINGFGEALSAGYFTVQDINPFMREVNAAKAEMQVVIGAGGAIYTDSSIDIIDGLDPDRHYIVCRGLITADGVAYAQGAEGRINSVEQLCGWLGSTPDATTIIVVPTTQPSDNGVPDP